MTYQEHRRRRHDELRGRLLTLIREAEEAGERVFQPDLAAKLRCCVSTVSLCWTELARQGLVKRPIEREREREAALLPDLDERIAAVREAKVRSWQRTGSLVLSKHELRKALP